MKNLFYVIAALLVVIWAILVIGLNASGPVHILLVVAALIILFRLVFNKILSNRET